MCWARHGRAASMSRSQPLQKVLAIPSCQGRGLLPLAGWVPGPQGRKVPLCPPPLVEARPRSPLSGRQVRSAPHSEQTRGESFSFSGSHQAFGGPSSWGHCCS